MSNKILETYNEAIHSKLLEICSPLFQKLPLTRFAYGELQEDQVLFLNTHLENLRSYITPCTDNGEDFQRAVKSTPLNQYYYFLWPEDTGDAILKRYRDQGIANGFTIYKRLEDRVLFWCFAADLEERQLAAYYMNEGKVYLHEFVDYFNTKAQSIIEDSPREKFQNKLDMTYQPSPFSHEEGNVLELSKYLVRVEDKQFFVSRRERQCLHYLARGMTAKEIGRLMGLAPKTIEFYLQNLREKTGRHLKSDLVKFYLDYRGVL